MDNLERCLTFTLGVEGGYTDNPADPGNWTGGEVGHGELRGTKFGISAAAYPKLDIVNLSQAAAEDIYRRDYWSQLQGDLLPLPIALVAFDAAVNAGPRRAILWLQQAVGQELDGIMGQATLMALCAANPVAMAREALVRRLDFYSHLPAWTNFGLGWTRRIVALAGEIGS
jgi:lysozyme family protein